MPATSKLKIGEINLHQIYILSKELYKSKVDDKARRARMDIRSIKTNQKVNFKYNRTTKTWERVNSVSKILFDIVSVPKSYELEEGIITKHQYPVTVTFKDVSLGLLSPFKWRTGGLRNPLFARKGALKEERINITNKNIRNGTQLQFFFELEFVSKMYGTLFGRCRANRPPVKTNPKNLLYLDKHMYAITNKVLIPLFNSGKGNQLSNISK